MDIDLSILRMLEREKEIVVSQVPEVEEKLATQIVEVVASRRAKGWISRRISSRSALRALVKSTSSMAGRIVCRATCCGPRSGSRPGGRSRQRRRSGRCPTVRCSRWTSR